MNDPALRVWLARGSSWLAGGLLGAALTVALMVTLPPPPWVYLAAPLPVMGSLYGFAWGYLGLRRLARRVGVPLALNLFERAPARHWHLRLLPPALFSGVLFLVAVAVFLATTPPEMLGSAGPPSNAEVLGMGAASVVACAFMGRAMLALLGALELTSYKSSVRTQGGRRETV